MRLRVWTDLGGGGVKPLGRALLLGLAALVAAVVALDLAQPVQAQGDEQSGRIVARRLDDGRTEFGWQPVGGERVLPRARYFPADAGVGRWLNSSPVEVGGVEIGRINARLREDGRIEFAFTPTDGERILPPTRYFPAGARVRRWLRSTEIVVGAAPTTGFVAVSAGGGHACGLRENGEVECWGRIAAGLTTPPAGPFRAVSAGGGHNCGLRESGVIECWGRDEYNDYDYGQADPPAGRFTYISAGGDYTCGVRDAGEIACWGGDEFGFGILDAPQGDYAAVSTGGAHNCGLRETGEITCWGLNAGDGRTTPPAGRFTAISSGGNHSCGLRETGEIECWGGNFWTFWNGEEEEFTHGGQIDAPAGRFSAVSVGAAHSCGLRDTGEIACWGWNDNGQTGVPAGRFVAVNAGHSHTCGVRGTGAIECWGSNDAGQSDAPDP